MVVRKRKKAANKKKNGKKDVKKLTVQQTIGGLSDIHIRI